MRSVVHAWVVLVLGWLAGMADIPSPPPQGFRVPLRIIEGGPANGLALLELPRDVLRDLAKGSGMRTADLLPPSGPGNPITRVAGGVLLSLGALFFGERFLRWWRKRNGSGLKLVPVGLAIWAALSMLSNRTVAQGHPNRFDPGTLGPAVSGGNLNGTVAVRIADTDRGEILLYVGGSSGGAGARRPVPSPPQPPRK